LKNALALNHSLWLATMVLSEILDKVCQNLDIERHEGPFAVPSQEEIDPNQICKLSKLPIDDYDELEELLYGDSLECFLGFDWETGGPGLGSMISFYRYRGLNKRTIYFEISEYQGLRLLCFTNNKWSRKLDVLFVDLLGQKNGERFKTAIFGSLPNRATFDLTCSWVVMVNFIYNVIENGSLWDDIIDSSDLWIQDWEYPTAATFLSDEDAKLLEEKFANIKSPPRSLGGLSSYKEELSKYKNNYSKKFGLANRKILYKKPRSLTPEIKQIISARFLLKLMDTEKDFGK
jgi:hypothetical protein